MTMGATFVAYACALMAYLYLVFTDPAYNSDGSFTPVVIAYAFLIGLQITNCFTTPLSSGIDTLFVAMAWVSRCPRLVGSHMLTALLVGSRSVDARAW